MATAFWQRIEVQPGAARGRRHGSVRGGLQTGAIELEAGARPSLAAGVQAGRGWRCIFLTRKGAFQLWFYRGESGLVCARVASSTQCTYAKLLNWMEVSG